ncbi:MAG: iron-sulfur cluster assembly accessory protein [Gammaproteobacteria bacterium]
MITVTAAAAAQIRTAAKQGHAEGLALRIAAKRVADGRIEYGMGFDDTGREDDLQFDSEGIQVVVAPLSLELLSGTVIDFVELSSGEFQFIFMNPNDPDYVPPEGDSTPH